MRTQHPVPTDRLGPDALAGIARLCALSLGEHSPDEDELDATLFNPEQPVTVRGDPAVGVVASVERGGQAFVRLLAVHPDRQRSGVGHALMEAAEHDLAGLGAITVGADAPDYLFPGVPSRLTPMFCLLEARGYDRAETNLNMDVDLRDLPPDPGGTRRAEESDRAELDWWMQKHWPWWRAEVRHALGKDRLLISHDDDGLSGFCAWDVNRKGWLGPIAVRPAAMGRRLGVPLLLGALHDMRTRGRTTAQIGWISPVRFYARTVGAVMGTAFIVARKPAPASEGPR